MSTRSFPDLLAATARADSARPFLTFYDDASGERTELSVTTYLNWVMKTANLLIEEYDLDEGDTVLIDLPTHWLGAVFIGAAWYAGIAITTDPDVPHELAVGGPDSSLPAGGPHLLCALLPFAVRFPQPLPEDSDDYGVLWPGQPDAFLGLPPSDATSVGWREADAEFSFAELSGEVATSSPGNRILTDAPAHTDRGRLLIEVLTGNGSLVLVRNADLDQQANRSESEHVTEVRLSA